MVRVVILRGTPLSRHNRQINFPWQFNYALIEYDGNETALKLQASRRSRGFSPDFTLFAFASRINGEFDFRTYRSVTFPRI